MKRHVAYLALSAAALTVAACGGSGQQDDTTMAEGGGALPTADATAGMMTEGALGDPLATGTMDDSGADPGLSGGAGGATDFPTDGATTGGAGAR